MNIDEIKLLDIQPSQFYISAKKLERVMKWFNPNDLSNFEPLPIFEHGGKIFFTDGHTRALAVFLSGLEKVPLVWDAENEIGITEYKICIKACEGRGIKNISDLEHRVLPHDEFVAKCIKLSLYKTDIIPKYGDKLLTLSTCSYNTDNERFVVFAKKINV